MKTTATYEVDIAANGSYQVIVGGSYFKILAATGDVDVRSESVDIKAIGAGQGFQKQPFKRLTITDKTGATNTVKFIVSDAEFIDSLNGTVGIDSNKAATSAAFANTANTVTNASAQLVAANTARQYLLIQNNDAAGSIFVRFGAASTLTTGVKIAPGGYFEWFGVVPTGAVHAIGSIASNANVVVVEG